MRDFIDRVALLTETPIASHLLGDETPGMFRSDDINLVTNPKALTKLHRVWRSSKADVELYLLNTPGDQEMRDDWLERSSQHAGPITPSAIKRKFGFDIPANRASITFVLTQNEGSERLPLTGWLIAHRMGHLFLDAKGSGNIHNPKIAHAIGQLEALRFKVQNVADQSYRLPNDQANTSGKHYPGGNVLELIGTTRAARQGNLSAPGEIIPEAFAQYMLTGKVVFQPAPATFPMTYTAVRQNPFGYERRTEQATVVDAEKLSHLNQMIANMAEVYQQVFDLVLAYAKGKIFLL